MREETWYKLIAFRQALQEVRSALQRERKSDMIAELNADLDEITPYKISDLLILEHRCPCAGECMDSFRAHIDCHFSAADAKSSAGKIFREVSEKMIEEAKEA